jgi:DNA-binding NtrC family response regulator
VRPVGSERDVPVDLRFIFATNAELEKEVEKGRFRPDLFFRINVMQIRLPPLKDREDDVHELATLFMRKLSQQLGMPPVPIGESVRAALTKYDWPGNVRELRNLIERSLILGVFPDDFGGHAAEASVGAADSLAEIERRHILAMLREVGGNKDEAARRLGISRKTIDRKCALWNV